MVQQMKVRRPGKRFINRQDSKLTRRVNRDITFKNTAVKNTTFKNITFKNVLEFAFLTLLLSESAAAEGRDLF